MHLIARQVLLPSLRPVHKVISSLDHREWAIISDQVSFGVRIAQEQLDFPLTTCIVSPFMLRSTEQLPAMPGKSLPPWAPRSLKRAFMGVVSSLWDRELAGEINKFRRSLGLGPVRDIVYDWSLSPQRVIGLFPEWFAKRASDWPSQFRYGGFTSAVEIGRGQCAVSVNCELTNRLGNTDRPTIAFCAGSAGSAGKRFFETAIAASCGQPWRSILVAPKFLPNGELPANVTQCGYVPLAQLLPAVDVIVHHGGLGTIANALAKGVPQIVMPFGHDQFDNAQRLEQLGVGRTLLGRAQSPSSLADSIETALRDHDLQQSCSSLAKSFWSDCSAPLLCTQLGLDQQNRSSGVPELPCDVHVELVLTVI
jgi:rhamnosyltransferase subunit B